MCGIVGALSWGNFSITSDYIISMRDTMIHRGPDGGGCWVNPEKTLGLGHRRLSIIDLSASANQPMATLDKSFWIVFNGEIYNHADIKKELEALGYHQWQTDHSDTEVILNAFAEWGIDCIHKFRGMFAFALWDARKQKLWLVRDRIGIKPLYYSVHHDRIVFASEIRALLKDPQQHRAINEEAVYHYLSFLVSPAPQTLFDNIFKLPPGTWLKISNNGEIIQQKYWDVWDNVRPLTDKTEEEISALILDELRTAVRLRKVSDVPVGIFLSGGIDSSTNAALFSENLEDVVKTFSIGYKGEYKSYQNELHYAKKMAEKVGAAHYEQLLTVNDLLDFLPNMIKLQDEPIADPVCVPVYYVSKLARENGVVVAQVGEGSDELFWGYQSWKQKYNLQRYSNIPGTYLFKKLLMQVMELGGKAGDYRYELLRRGVQGVPIFWSGAEAFTEYRKQQILSPRLRQKFAKLNSWQVIEPNWNCFQEKAWDKSILHWMSYQDLNLRLPELLLMRVDKMSMGVSLEGRVPFLDHKFVELVMGIPSKLKTKNNQLKYILKKSVRGIIPNELIDRPKQGFGVPIAEWFYEKLNVRIKQELIDFNQETDFFDPVQLEKIYSGKGDPKEWWPVFNLALWWREYIR